MLTWTSRVSEWAKLAHADAWGTGDAEWGAGWGGRRAYRTIGSSPWVANESDEYGASEQKEEEGAGGDAASSSSASGLPQAARAAHSWPAPEPVTAAFVRTASMQTLSTALSVANHETAVASARRGGAGAEEGNEGAEGGEGHPGTSLPFLSEVEDVADEAAAIADEVAAAIRARARAQVDLSSLPPAASDSTLPDAAAAEAGRFRRRPQPSPGARAEEALELPGDGSGLELESLRAAARALETGSERVTWDEVLEGASAEARRAEGDAPPLPEGDAPPSPEAESLPDARVQGNATGAVDLAGAGRRLAGAADGLAPAAPPAAAPAAAPLASEPPLPDQLFDASDDVSDASSETSSSDDTPEDGTEIEEAEDDLDADSPVGAPEPAPGPSPEPLPPPPPPPSPPTYIPGPAPNPNVQDELLVTGQLYPVAQGTRLPMFVWTMPSSAGTYYATSQAGDDCEKGMLLIVRVIATSGPCS